MLICLHDKHEGKENPATECLGLKPWVECSTSPTWGSCSQLGSVLNAWSLLSDSLRAEHCTPGLLHLDLHDRYVTSLQDFWIPALYRDARNFKWVFSPIYFLLISLLTMAVPSSTFSIVLENLLPCCLAPSPIPSAQRQEHSFSIWLLFWGLHYKWE